MTFYLWQLPATTTRWWWTTLPSMCTWSSCFQEIFPLAAILHPYCFAMAARHAQVTIASEKELPTYWLGKRGWLWCQMRYGALFVDDIHTDINTYRQTADVFVCVVCLSVDCDKKGAPSIRVRHSALKTLRELHLSTRSEEAASRCCSAVIVWDSRRCLAHNK